MQSGIPSLPVVCSDKHSCSSSKYSESLSGTPRKGKLPLSATRLLKRKPFNDVYGVNSPYRNSSRFYPLAQPSKSSKSQVSQRILSAKMLRVKQLQNQLTDAHYHLNELSNENKLLKAIQKKQESALRKYEGTNAELPRIINSHHEDLRVLQAKYKKLKEQHKVTCDSLKEKEKELHSLQVFNKKLLQLSQNRNLLERDKLQSQVTDLSYQMEQQQNTIQNLNKKLTLETKSLKQQLHSEVVKHKETQKNLQDTLEKLKSLEDMLDNREKRLYYNNQLPVFNKTRSIAGNCSFSSLEDSGVSLNYSKSSVKKIESDLNDKILPSLSDLDMNFERKMNGKSQESQLLFLPPGQKFRLSKSASRSISAKSTDMSEKSASSLKKVIDEDDLSLSPQEIEKLDLSSKEEDDKCHKLDSIDYNNLPQLNDIQDFVEETDLKHEELFRKSRQVCARLTSEQSPLISSRTMTIANHRGNYEEIERMVQEEFDKGQNYALSVFQSGPERTFIQDEKDSTNDVKTQDDMLSEKEIKTDVIATNRTESVKTSEKSDDSEHLAAEVNEDKVSSSTDVPEEKGSETFRQSNSNDDLELFFDKLVCKNGSVDDDEAEEVEKFALKERERLNLYLESEGKSDVEKVTKNSSESRRNSRDNKNEKKSESDKKDSRKLTTKGFDKEKLLAEMKAIDNNDNIEYYDQKGRKNSGNDRTQITENLYRGIPTQRRGDALTILNTKLDTKAKSNGIMKFH